MVSVFVTVIVAVCDSPIESATWITTVPGVAVAVKSPVEEIEPEAPPLTTDQVEAAFVHEPGTDRQYPPLTLNC